MILQEGELSGSSRLLSLLRGFEFEPGLIYDSQFSIDASTTVSGRFGNANGKSRDAKLPMRNS